MNRRRTINRPSGSRSSAAQAGHDPAFAPPDPGPPPLHASRLRRAVALWCVACTAVVPSDAAEPEPLFNGRDLAGWHTWLVDSRREDPRHVFSVTNGLLRISGDGLGYLATAGAFENYRLVVEWKWGTQNTQWGDRIGKARDSGVFLHATGPDGNSHDGQGAFMAALECNLFQGATGDLLLIRGTDADGTPIAPRITAEVAAERDPDGWYTWRTGGREQTIERWGRLNWFAKAIPWRDRLDFRGSQDVERPPGEWNHLECLAQGDTLQFTLNGVLVNQARNVHPRRGRILLQCEGSEIFFRKVEVHRLRKPD